MGAVWVVIPARLGSSRLPDKPLLDVAGVPLVERVWRLARSASLVDRCVVATGDQRIADSMRSVGADVVVTGPAVSGTHRALAALEGASPSVVVNVQGDQPGLDPNHVDLVITAIQSGHQVATLAAPLTVGAADPSRVKVVTDRGGDALYFSRAAIPHGGPYRVHLGIYGFALSALRRCCQAPRGGLCDREDLEQLAWMEAGETVHVLSVEEACQPVDDPGSLAAVRAELA